MPTDLSVRRERGFRPVAYTERHKLVAILHGLGQSREEIAQLTAYSPSHVSRITHMPEARREAAEISAHLAQELIRVRLAAITDRLHRRKEDT